MRRNPGEAQKPTFRRPLGRQFGGVGAEPPPPTPGPQGSIAMGSSRVPGTPFWGPLGDGIIN